MKSVKKARNLFRVARIGLAVLVILIGLHQSQVLREETNETPTVKPVAVNDSPAALALAELAIKGRAPKTGYSRSAFSNGWGQVLGCDVRNYILTRDLVDITLVPSSCKFASGTLVDPYTASTMLFLRGPDTSDDIQIDHVVALSDAWQKGAQQLAPVERYNFANDPLNLLAVQGAANQAKSDSDAATWLPPNKAYRCSYVARQIAVKQRYALWVTRAEYSAMESVLRGCPEQKLPNDA